MFKIKLFVSFRMCLKVIVKKWVNFYINMIIFNIRRQNEFKVLKLYDKSWFQSLSVKKQSTIIINENINIT